MGSITLSGVRKSYGNLEVIHGVSVNVDEGSFVTLVGPSGCGKSTLLRMIAGLETISGGTITIGSRVVNDVAPKDRDIAMVFQSYALYPHMTVAQNMGFSLRLAKAPKAEITAKVERAANILGLQPLLERYPRQLSGGQRQRVAMGRAIVRNPQAFLFDEPLSNLDAKLRVQMRSEIKALHQRLGTTTVYVTHDQIEAMTLADTIVVLQGGIVEQIGAPLELYDKPANAFVAGFIGSPAMNFIEGVMRNGKFTTKDGLSLAVEAAPGVSDGMPVQLGVRPEHLELSDDGLATRIVTIEPTGPETMVSGQAEGLELICLLKDRVHMHPGETIKLRPKPGRVHFFDVKDGRRL